MTRILMKTALSVLALGLMGANAHAGFYDHHDHGRPNVAKQSQAYIQQVNARQAQQMRRIEAARRAGLLSRHEFSMLKHEQQQIRTLERKFRADGILNAREFQLLDRALYVAQRNIRMETLARNAYHGHGHGQGSRYN
ncbi:MAG: hypothetical protein ACLGGY_04500 [Gammaproteobacteria bacterium]